MIQTDILLDNLPKKYEIIVDKNHHYDIICNKGYNNYDVYLYNTADRQSIYGDELSPLIFYLTENNIDCLIEVDMFQRNLHNYLSLKPKKLQIGEQSLLTPKKQIAELKVDTDVSFETTADVNKHNMTLMSTGDIASISRGKPKKSSARLVSEVTDDISKLVELVLNTSGVHWFEDYLYKYDDMPLSKMDVRYPQMSLVSFCGKVYMKCSFDIEKHMTYLSGSIGDLTAYINLKETIINNLHFSSDVPFSYQITCLCGKSNSKLNTPMLSVVDISYVSLESRAAYLETWVTDDVYTETAFDIAFCNGLNISITDDMEIYYGLRQYDNRDLYYWDGYTINDMSAEIVNKS